MENNERSNWYIEIAQDFLEEEWCEEDGNGWVEFAGTPKQIVQFAEQIRRDALFEVISVLRSVPNPNANLAAIDRIESMLG